MAIVLLILSLLTSEYSTIQENEILTSKAWLQYFDNTDHTSKHVFHKNGEYTVEMDLLKMNGRWSWIDTNEIVILIEGIKTDTT